jgi:hypothetical protein
VLRAALFSGEVISLLDQETASSLFGLTCPAFLAGSQ